MHGTVDRHRDLQGRAPDAQGPANLPGRAARRDGHDRSLMARPAVPRSDDRQGRRAAGDAATCASSTAASFSRASTSTSATTSTRTAQGRVLSVYPATEGLSFKVIRSIIDAHLDALLPLVTEYLPPDVLKAADVPGIGDALRMVHRPSSLAEAMRGRVAARVRGAVLRSAAAPARQGAGARAARRHPLREQTQADDAAARSAAVPAHRRAGAMRSARSSPTCAATAACSGCSRATSAAARRSSRCSPRCWRSRTGYQAAIMAPTELLAEQHVRLDDATARAARHRAGAAHREPARDASARRSPRDWRPTSRCSSSARTRSCRRPRRSRSSASRPIDEQHRFGVEQRKALGAKGEVARRAAHVGDADPALARAHAVRRSRSEHARRAAAGSTSDHDGAAPRVGARARAAVRRSAARAGTPGVRRVSGDRGVGEDRPQGGDDDVRGARRRAVRESARGAAARSHSERRARRRSCAAFATARSTCSSRRR